MCLRKLCVSTYCSDTYSLGSKDAVRSGSQRPTADMLMVRLLSQSQPRLCATSLVPQVTGPAWPMGQGSSKSPWWWSLVKLPPQMASSPTSCVSISSPPQLQKDIRMQFQGDKVILIISAVLHLNSDKTQRNHVTLYSKRKHLQCDVRRLPHKTCI